MSIENNSKKENSSFFSTVLQVALALTGLYLVVSSIGYSVALTSFYDDDNYHVAFNGKPSAALPEGTLTSISELLPTRESGTIAEVCEGFTSERSHITLGEANDALVCCWSGDTNVVPVKQTNERTYYMCGE